MEHFYLPTSSESMNYKNLVLLFQLLKEEYITNNGIISDSNIDLKKNILHNINFYELFHSNINSVSLKLFINNPVLNNFNLQELFLINRMVFLRYKRVGFNLTIFDLFDNLKVLEVS